MIGETAVTRSTARQTEGPRSCLQPKLPWPRHQPGGFAHDAVSGLDPFADVSAGISRVKSLRVAGKPESGSSPHTPDLSLRISSDVDPKAGLFCLSDRRGRGGWCADCPLHSHIGSTAEATRAGTSRGGSARRKHPL